MSTAIPGKHIEGMVRAFAHDQSHPVGWTLATCQSYLEDADGGRAACRAVQRETFNAAPERDAEDWRVD